MQQDISKISLYYRQSARAIELGVHLRNEKSMFCYDDYYIYDTIDVTTKTLDYSALCTPLLLKLMDYDALYNTNFTQSLFVYLACNCNLAESARICGIHRNSMDYRIKKIQELFDVNLDDPEEVFSISFSFKLLIHHKKFKPVIAHP